MEALHFVPACQTEHFRDMSLLHALGWRTTYQDAVPDDYMAREITDERWVPLFQQDYQLGRCHGLLLYRGDTPVACCNYGPARTDNYNSGSVCQFQNDHYQGWGEVISFYTHPDEKGKGYGRMLMEQCLRALKADGFSRCFVLVLRENASARRFYSANGFSWDGTHEDIPFPPDTICVDLRYTREL